MVGRDRFEGEHAARQLSELYRALRLYVNCFQPSLKLQAKAYEGRKVRRVYKNRCGGTIGALADLLRIEPLMPMCPHQLLDLLPALHEEGRTVLERRRGAIALRERLCGWISIIATPIQLASAFSPLR